MFSLIISPQRHRGARRMHRENTFFRQTPKRAIARRHRPVAAPARFDLFQRTDSWGSAMLHPGSMLTPASRVPLSPSEKEQARSRICLLLNAHCILLSGFMNIGITVYPTYGGSGIVGSELGKELAARGHTVHFISSALPTRLTELKERVRFHEVEMMSYPLFEHQPYSLALATKMVQIAEAEKLDLL